MPLTRNEYLERLRAVVTTGRSIIGAGAGTGISAKCAEQGGADLIVIYNSGRYRMAGRGSRAGLLAYGDANAIIVEMSREVLPIVKSTPVLAGVQNFPTVGLIDGVFRANLEETGMGFDLEIEMIYQGHQIDLLTCPYVFDPEQSRRMAQAGADVIVAHAGLTTKGTIGAKTSLSLDQAVDLVQSIRDAAVSVNPHILTLCHGGPLADPDDVEYLLGRTRGIAGFFGASSMEWNGCRLKGPLRNKCLSSNLLGLST